jgi:hypothetical protein
MNPLLQIPLHRLLIYIGAIALIPIVLALFSHQNTQTRYEATSGEMKTLHQQILLHEARESTNKSMRNMYADSDHHYTGSHVESLQLLQNEVTSLNALLTADDAGVDETLIKRLMFLKEQNKLSFAEGQVVQYGLFQETTETLTYPVEVDENDITEILDRIERAPLKEKPPQILITKFHLERKNRPDIKEQDQTFHLNLQMVIREF